MTGWVCCTRCGATLEVEIPRFFGSPILKSPSGWQAIHPSNAYPVGIIEFRCPKHPYRNPLLEVKPERSNAMTLKPLGDRVLVLPEEEPDKIGMLHVPETAKGKHSQKGEVLAVGPGKAQTVGHEVVLLPLGVKPGDVVYFQKYAGNPVEVAGKDALMLREDDIIGIVE